VHEQGLKDGAVGYGIEIGKMVLWFAKTLADFEINDIAALPPLLL
jgi:hypothetical protein